MIKLAQGLDAFSAVRWIYGAALALGTLGICVVLLRVAHATGASPITLFRRRNAGELLRVAGFVGYVALYLGGTFLPTLMPFRPLWPMRAAGIAAGAALVFGGGLVYFTAVATLGDSFRIGGDPGAGARLVMRGIYARTRHPIYAAILIELLGMAVMYPCPLAIAALPLALVGCHAQAEREERWWLAHRGDAYGSYLLRTGRFLPRRRRSLR